MEVASKLSTPLGRHMVRPTPSNITTSSPGFPRQPSPSEMSPVQSDAGTKTRLREEWGSFPLYALSGLTMDPRSSASRDTTSPT